VVLRSYLLRGIILHGIPDTRTLIAWKQIGETPAPPTGIHQQNWFPEEDGLIYCSFVVSSSSAIDRTPPRPMGTETELVRTAKKKHSDDRRGRSRACIQSCSRFLRNLSTLLQVN
jgi:hypothetical protein